jgi:hypothetical protein
LTSESLAQLSDFGERLFWRLTTIADDFGRFAANPSVVAGRTMPLISGATAKKIDAALAELESANAVRRYTVDGKHYAYFVGWKKHQITRAKYSKFPEPPTSADICQQMPTDENDSDKVCARPNSNSDSHSHSDLNSSEGESEGKPDKPPPLTPEDLVEGWNEVCAPAGLPKVEMLSATRRQKALCRLRDHPDDAFWNVAMARVRASPFLTGKNERKWKANFDWLIDNDTNAVKVYEGRYAKEN